MLVDDSVAAFYWFEWLSLLFSTNIVAIQDNAQAHIPPIKTLARLHNLNTGKFFTIRDLHNQREKLRRQDLTYLTPIQHLLQEIQTSDFWFTFYQLDGYKQLTYSFFAFEPSLDFLEVYPDLLFCRLYL